MTAHNFQPGDVAMLPVGGRGWFVGVTDDEPRPWRNEAGVPRWGDPCDNLTPRPLVVIDPEEIVHPARLVGILRENGWATIAANIEAATAPPKPDEPTGLGAAVVDDVGVTWVRIQTAAAAPWIRANAGSEEIAHPYRYWSGIAAVRVLSEGVTT